MRLDVAYAYNTTLGEVGFPRTPMCKTTTTQGKDITVTVFRHQLCSATFPVQEEPDDKAN